MNITIKEKRCLKCHDESLIVSIPESATRETITVLQNTLKYTAKGGIVGDVLRLVGGEETQIETLLDDVGDGTHIECENCEFMISFSRYYDLFY